MSESIVRLLLHGTRLKQMPRTGWLQRGVPNPEDVAAHSYGVALTAMALAEMIDQPFIMARVLAMAVLHDLPESLTSDVPSPVKRFFPDEMPNVKTWMERSALQEMTADVPFGGDWRSLWEEMAEKTTLEAQLIHDADKIDMYLQAFTYEQQFGNSQIAQFWQKRPDFHFAESETLYDILLKRRGA